MNFLIYNGTMTHYSSMLLIGLFCLLAGCGDGSTPESSILKLEQAFRAKDIQASVACIDFKREAELTLAGMGDGRGQNDSKLVTQMAQATELAFRNQIKALGFPDFSSVVSSSFTKKEKADNDIVIVTEVCQYKDGGTTTEQIKTTKASGTWRVLPSSIYYPQLLRGKPRG